MNKWRLHQRLADSDFLPDFRLAGTLEQTSDAIAALGYPQRRLCVRPVTLSGGRGLHFLDPDANVFQQRMLEKPGPIRCSADEFLETRRAGPAEFPLVISEYLPGDDLGIDLLAHAGEVIELVVRRKRGPSFHGNPMRHEFDERGGERQWVARLAAELELSGLICIDARYDENGRLRLVEINPRPSACVGMSCARVHLPAWAIDLALGDREIDTADYYAEQPARRVVRALAEVAIDSSGARLLSPERRAVMETNADASALPCGTS
ncbi:MAG: ATP-grasp domain-containing protein [Planctomycetes bacterium]|nr:ATP-grasp domain-containing protein [Planctomycetota bacterium]